MSQINSLFETAGKLTQTQVGLLCEMANALIKPLEEYVNPNSDILTPAFRENFSNRLKLYHATNEQKLSKKTFEYAFWASSLSAGQSAEIVSSQTNPGSDVIVNGTSFSLKTEASKDLNKTKITISKLMEARWIRECLNEEDFARCSKERITSHLNEYERIITLRAYHTAPDKVKYDFMEIPKAHFLLINNVSPKDFSSRSKSGGSSAKIKITDTLSYTLRLDGSVEKITISGLPVESCFLHGSWIVPLVTVQQLGEEALTDFDDE